MSSNNIISFITFQKLIYPSSMGLPKKLTEQQMKNWLGKQQPSVHAGKDSARQYASKLQNPKLYPLVVK